MNNRLTNHHKADQHRFYDSGFAMLFACLLLFACGVDKNAGRVDFICLDQSGAPLEKAEVLLAQKKQQSDDQGRCQFQIALDPTMSRLAVHASRQGYQFIGPDSVHLEVGERLTYALNFWDNQAILSASAPSVPVKVTFDWISPDRSQDRIEPPEESAMPSDEPPPVITTFLLTITSQPTNSKVTIKSRNRTIDQGRTPYSRTYRQGRYTVEAVSDSGYKSKSENVTLNSTRTIHIEHEVLPRAVKVATEPENANVYLNGKRESGATPLKLVLKQVGSYDLEIQKTGFKPHKQKITFFTGARDTSIFVRLTGLPHDVIIQLKEKGKVFIDDKQINTRWQDRIEVRGITAGYHKIEILYQKENKKVTHEKYFITGVSGQVYDF